MLKIDPSLHRERPYLRILQGRAEAWIAPRLWRYGSTDWDIWVVRNGTPSRAQCQLHLEVESLLRSWLIRKYHVPLRRLSYEELRGIAEGKAREVLSAQFHGAALPITHNSKQYST